MATPWLGLRTAIYPVSDLAKATAWYRSVLGIAPYFEQPFYVGFNVGGYKLGLDPDTSHIAPGTAGVTAYWGVPDISAAWQRLLAHSAKPWQEIQETGGGIKVAAVLDPFGNVFGLIENPHFLPEKPEKKPATAKDTGTRRAEAPTRRSAKADGRRKASPGARGRSRR